MKCYAGIHITSTIHFLQLLCDYLETTVYLLFKHLSLWFRIRVPVRFMGTKLPLMGIYPGAEVIRGPDWQWRDQDGKVIAFCDETWPVASYPMMCGRWE